jgi:hypothetical protein
MAAYMNATSARMFLEMPMHAGHPSLSQNCPSPFTLIDTCRGASPTGEQVTYQYWSCTWTAQGK